MQEAAQKCPAAWRRGWGILLRQMASNLFKTRDWKGQAVLVSLWVAIAVALVIFHKALLPLAIAVVIAYLLEPVVTRLSRWRIRGRSLPRWVAVVLLYLVVGSLLYLFAVTAVPKLYGELSGLTRAGLRFFNELTPERIAELSERLELWMLHRGLAVDLGPADPQAPAAGLALDLQHVVQSGLASLSGALKAHFVDAVGLMQDLVAGVLGLLFRFFFILVVSAFLLIDWARIGRFFRSLIPPGRQGDYDEVMRAIDGKLAGVVRGQATICVINGMLTAIGLTLFGVPFVFVLSLVAMVLSAIPIFGSVISSLPIVLIALTRGFGTAAEILAWIVGIHALEAYVLNPKILGSHANIHPVLVAFALLAGEATYGFVGALFAVPVAGILAAVFTCAHERALRKLSPEAVARRSEVVPPAA